jgi:hypothetical protein
MIKSEPQTLGHLPGLLCDEPQPPGLHHRVGVVYPQALAGGTLQALGVGGVLIRKIKQGGSEGGEGHVLHHHA